MNSAPLAVISIPRILLFLSAQRMIAKHSLRSWFYSWSTNTLFIGFVYTYSLITSLLHYKYTGTVIDSVCVKIAQVQCNLLFLLNIRRYYPVSIVTIQSASLLLDSVVTIRYWFWLVSYQFIIGPFVSYRYVEITITNGVIIIFFQL